MKNRIIISLFLLAAFCATTVFAQNCDDFGKLVDKTYNFKPSKISSAERDAKSVEMDVVWNKVKANPQTLLPCLREAIRTRTNDSFFRFDASNLLIQFDPSKEAKEILIDAFAKVDFADIALQYWLPYIAILGYEGFDTSAAGETWLKYPNPRYTLPQHGGREVTKEIGALSIYGSMDEAMALPALVKIASQENHSGREIAIGILLQQATAESFKELKKLNQKGLSEATKQKMNSLLSKPNLLTAREGTPKITRQQYLDAFQQLTNGKTQLFMKLTVDVPDGEKDAIAVLKQEDIPLVRKARRIFAASANPHTAEWYKSFTNILLAMTWKPELVK
ncbi:MAG TPA: hypothetical protein PKE69_11835 [Pyrinomonadaceae bacterium]|nr:hypothetical protein [Pyrinomonadaceae bacterium]